MTLLSDRQLAREERIAIMVHDGDCSEEEAEEYCDQFPIMYGIRQLHQDTLFQR